MIRSVSSASSSSSSSRHITTPSHGTESHYRHIKKPLIVTIMGRLLRAGGSSAVKAVGIQWDYRRVNDKKSDKDTHLIEPHKEKYTPNVNRRILPSCCKIGRILYPK
jgi:hypothetical protein